VGRKRTGTVYLYRGKLHGAITLRNKKRHAFVIPSAYIGTTQSKILAREYVEHIQALYDAGDFDPADKSDDGFDRANPPTVAEFAERFLAGQSYSTRDDDVHRVARYLKPSKLGRMRMVDVRPRHILAFIDALGALPSRRGGTLAARSVRNVYSVVQRVFRRAVLVELIDTSPCAETAAALPRIADKTPGARASWKYTRAEVERLLAHAKVPEIRRVFYALSFLTGARFGEVAALRWRDYDAEVTPLGRITIARSVERSRRTIKDTKTGAIKLVPVHPTLAAMLAAWRAGWAAKYGRAPEPNDLIVPNEHGKTRGTSSSYQMLQIDCDHLGIPLRPMAQHGSRHTFITLAREDGARGELLRWVTHAPPKAMLDAYTSPSWTSLCEEICKLKIERRGA